MAAAHTLAHLVTESDLAQGSLYPALSRMREVSAHIAAAVAESAYATGVADRTRPSDLLQDVSSQMYQILHTKATSDGAAFVPWILLPPLLKP